MSGVYFSGWDQGRLYSGKVFYDRGTPLLTKEAKVKYTVQEEKDLSCPKKIVQNENLSAALFNGVSLNKSPSLLSFQKTNFRVLNVIHENVIAQETAKRQQKFVEDHRVIEIKPRKKLDASGLSADFYSSVLDISAKGNVAIGLEDSLYVMNSKLEDKKTKQFSFNDEENFVTCVHSIGKTDRLFSGFERGDISYIDSEVEKITRVDSFLTKKICCAASQVGASSLYFGTYDGHLLQASLNSSLKRSSILLKDENPICGLALSSDGMKLAAGTNGNKIKIWDLRKSKEPYIVFDCYQAAVKALTWSPWESDVIFAGGGSADPIIRKLSTTSGKILAEDNSIGAQVTAIHPCDSPGKIISCHGGFSRDQYVAMVWENSRNQFIAKMKLSGHTGRVLHSALSNDKRTLLTAGADDPSIETAENILRVWEISKAATTYSKENKEPLFNGPHSYMR